MISHHLGGPPLLPSLTHPRTPRWFPGSGGDGQRCPRRPSAGLRGRPAVPLGGCRGAQLLATWCGRACFCDQPPPPRPKGRRHFAPRPARTRVPGLRTLAAPTVLCPASGGFARRAPLRRCRLIRALFRTQAVFLTLLKGMSARACAACLHVCLCVRVYTRV